MVTQEQNKLIWRTSGETMVVEPWGPNALRVRSVMMGEIEDTDYALLPPEKTACTIETGRDRASITNGKLTAVVELASSGWFRDHGKLTFYNQKGEILFEDIDQRGCAQSAAAALPARGRRGDAPHVQLPRL